MKATTVKPRASRARGRAGNSPEPVQFTEPSMAAACGHSHCQDRCRVRYIGPTSHIRDHHILHTARGVAHVWTATIIAGLAIVITGAIAFSAVNAQNQYQDAQRVAQSTDQIINKIDTLEHRMAALEKSQAELGQQTPPTPVTPNSVFPSIPQ